MTTLRTTVIIEHMLLDDTLIQLPKSVELLCLTMGAPLLLQGKLENFENNDEMLLFTSSTPIPIRLENHRAIINFKQESIPMFTLNIEKQTSLRLYLEYSHSHPREKRLFPRLFAQIPMLIHETNEDYLVAKWLEGELSPDDTWIQPEPFMNFSINGVSFQSDTPCTRMSTVLIELHEYKIVARVIRCAEENGRYDIALYFEEISEEAIRWLSDMTLRIQDALL